MIYTVIMSRKEFDDGLHINFSDICGLGLENNQNKDPNDKLTIVNQTPVNIPKDLNELSGSLLELNNNCPLYQPMVDRSDVDRYTEWVKKIQLNISQSELLKEFEPFLPEDPEQNRNTSD